MKLKYNGFDITFECEQEYMSIQEALGFEATGADHSNTIDKVLSGELEHLIIGVIASKGGIELGRASLGSCIYESLESAIQLWIGGYLPQLANEAIEEAKEALESLQSDQL